MTSSTCRALAERVQLIRRAFALEYFTIGWVLIEAAVAISSGVVAHSMTLVAFGADSVIELLSAGVLIWRLAVELRQGDEFSEAVEARAGKIAAALLLVLCVYVLSTAGWSLWHRSGQEFSVLGFAVALAAIPAMYFLANQKFAIAERIASPALKADAVEAIACGYLSFVVVIGLAAQALLHAWWIDSVTSVAILFVLIREAREAWHGNEC